MPAAILLVLICPAAPKACFGCGTTEQDDGAVSLRYLGSTLPTAVPADQWLHSQIPQCLRVTVRGQPYVSTYVPRPNKWWQAPGKQTHQLFAVPTYYCAQCFRDDPVFCLMCQCGCEDDREDDEPMLYVKELDGPTYLPMSPGFYNSACITRRCASCRILMHNNYDQLERSEFALVQPLDTDSRFDKHSLSCPMVCKHCVRPCFMAPEQRRKMGLPKIISCADTLLASDAEYRQHGRCNRCPGIATLASAPDPDDAIAASIKKKLKPQAKRHQPEHE